MNAKSNDHSGVNLQVVINIGDQFNIGTDSTGKVVDQEWDSVYRKNKYRDIIPKALTENLEKL